MKLVLLKKLKQSQQLKENVAVLPPSIPQSALPPSGLPSGLSITPTTVKVPSSKIQQPQAAHSRHSSSNSHKPNQGSVSSLLRGVFYWPMKWMKCFLLFWMFLIATTSGQIEFISTTINTITFKQSSKLVGTTTAAKKFNGATAVEFPARRQRFIAVCYYYASTATTQQGIWMLFYK